MASDPQLRHTLRLRAVDRTVGCGSFRHGFLVPKRPFPATALAEPQSAAPVAGQRPPLRTVALYTGGFTQAHVLGAPSLASVDAGDGPWGRYEIGVSRPTSLGWESEETRVRRARRDHLARSRRAATLRSTLDSNVRVV